MKIILNHRQQSELADRKPQRDNSALQIVSDSRVGSKNPTKRSFQTAWFERLKDNLRTTFAFTTDSRVNGVWHFRTLLQSLDSSRRKLLSEISILGLKLLLVMAATNAVSERSFSDLKQVKTYLHPTTGDSRLNHLMMLHVHKDRTYALAPRPCRRSKWLRWGERKPKATVWQIFRKRYPKQVLYFVSRHKRKIRDKTRVIVHNCSYLTCTKKYTLTKGPKRGWGGGEKINVGYSLSPSPPPPPRHFLLAAGLGCAARD